MGEWSGRVQYRSKISWFLYFKWQRQSYWVLDSFGLQRYSLAWNGWYPHPLCYSSQWIWIFITPRKSRFRRTIFCSGTLELIDQSRLSFLLFDFYIKKACQDHPCLIGILVKNIANSLLITILEKKYNFLINCKDLKILELIFNLKIRQ